MNLNAKPVKKLLLGYSTSNCLTSGIEQVTVDLSMGFESSKPGQGDYVYHNEPGRFFQMVYGETFFESLDEARENAREKARRKIVHVKKEVERFEALAIEPKEKF